MKYGLRELKMRVLWGGLNVVRWLLAAVGLAALVLSAMIAVPVKRPAALPFIADAVRDADNQGIPPLQTFRARDGSILSYRHYVPSGQRVQRAAVLIHGSSGSSYAMHPLAKALAARGVESFVPDIRGHGASGTHGDIGYIGQLDDDMADLVAHIRSTGVSLPLTLVGHSSGGGFALRIASSANQNLFVRTVLLSPMLGIDSPSTRPNAGGWASPSIPRIIGLIILRNIGIICCEGLPVVAFATPENLQNILTSQYSFRLLSNFGARRDFHADLNGVKGPMTLIAGANDELMVASKYEEAVKGTAAKINFRILEGANHMDVVSSARFTDVVAEDVATR
jgi:pimeloyl-ACP methyl ester carboxylesterase